MRNRCHAGEPSDEESKAILDCRPYATKAGPQRPVLPSIKYQSSAGLDGRPSAIGQRERSREVLKLTRLPIRKLGKFVHWHGNPGHQSHQKIDGAEIAALKTP